MADKPIEVLLVEDNPGDADLIQEALAEITPARFRLTRAGRLEAARQFLSTGRYDAVLLDLSLPDSYGLDTLAGVQAQAPAVPIVVLSGLADEALAVSAVQAGAQDYLVKGQVDSRLLVRSLRYAIERRRAALDCIIIVDRDGKVVEFDAAAEEVFGHPRAAALGRELSELIIPPASRAAYRAEGARRRALGDASALCRPVEITALRADGTEFPVELALTPMATGGPPRLAVHVRDITERKRAEWRRTARLEVTQVLAEATSVPEAMPRILRAAGESLGWDVGAFWVVDRGGPALRCLALWLAPALGVAGFAAASRGATFAPGVGLPGRAWSGGQPVWVPDVTADPDFPRAPLALVEGLHGAFACPVRVEGEILGVIEFFSRRVQQPDEDLLEMMAAIGGQIGQFMERRRAEEGLRRSEARKAAILEAALDCIITVDHEERILEFNPAAERAFGYPRDAVLGRRMSELIIPPGHRAAHRRGLRRYLASGEGPVLGRRVEMPALRADGTEFPAELSIVPTMLDGRPIFTGYLRDITERKRAEEALRESEVRSRQLADNLPHGFIYQIVRDPASGERFSYVSGGVEQIFGITAAEVATDPAMLYGRIVDEDLPRVRAEEDAALRAGTSFDCQFRTRARDGEIRWLHCRSAPRLLPGGGAIWDGIALDITERQRAEKALRESERRFRAIFEQSPLGMLIYAPDGRVRRGNQAFERWFGVAVEEMKRSDYCLFGDPQLIAGGALPAIERAFGGEPTWEGPAVYYEPGRQFSSTRRDGLWVSALLYPLKDDAGRVVEVFAMLEDFTERKRAEGEILALNRDLERRVEERTAELAAANARLQAEIAERRQVEEELRHAQRAAEGAAKAKDEFLAMISHELRTPLNGVIGMVDLLSESALDGQQRGYAQVARTSADLLLGIINDILDLSRIESGRLELDPVDFNPAEVVEEVAAMLALRAEEKGLELACQVRPEVDAWVRGDRGRLRQVLTNLMSNAIKFTDRGEVVARAEAEAEVVVRAEAEGRAGARVLLRFTVRDTGIGIDPDRMGRLFRPFSQADASTTRKYGGSGLGLAISRHLAQAMGGQIGAESVPGRGSTFWFTVAIEPASPAASATSQVPPGVPGLRALIVDDNATNRWILHEQLASLGIVPAQAPGGPEALARLEAAAGAGCPFDLAILDLHMPGMDGVELGAAIRADPRLASTVLVLLGSMSHQATADELKARGFAAWAAKPVGRLQLRRLIAAAVAGAVAARGGATTTAAGPEPAAPAGPVPAPEAEGRPALRVLVAEDSKANQLVAVGMLAKMGHAARVASDGAEAIAAVAGEAFDLILMDVQMPEVDGFQAAAAIRALEAARGTCTPIVAVTAHAVKGDRERCLAAGMDAYLSKPLRRQDLARVIADVLRAGRDRAPAGPGPAPAARAPGPVLDRAAALARLEGDEALFAELVDVYLDEWPRLVAEIRDALAAGDLPALGHKAHRLCGLAKTFDAHAASDAAARLEGLSAEGDRAAAALASAEVEVQFTRLRDALAGKADGPRGDGQGTHHSS